MERLAMLTLPWQRKWPCISAFSQDHEFIRDELEMMRSFMMVAHEERDGNMVIETWVKQVRDVAYDVEDYLQDFAVRLEKPSWWRVSTLLERRRVAKKMKEPRAKVEDVSKRNKRYHLIKASGSKPATSGAEQSSIITATIFGINEAKCAAKQDKQRVDLVQLINMDGNDLKVIALWGTGGDIGLTSIIMAAFENPNLLGKFPVRAWVRVMHPFSPEGFMQSFVSQSDATQGVASPLKAHKLVQKFNEYVGEQRCLIVLNDPSTIEEWHQIKTFFQNNRKGSRFVVSTTQVEIASLCAGKESQASMLKELSADQTLYVFYDKDFQNGRNLMKSMSNSNEATTSVNNNKMDPSDIIIEDQSKDGDANKMVRKSLTRMSTGVRSFKESQFIGRLNEIEKIKELILNSRSTQQVLVISVWGMGGLGKTTLVNGVFQSQKRNAKFDKSIFVTIMRPFKPEELLRSLAMQLYEDYSTKEKLLDGVSKKKPLTTMGIPELTDELTRLLKK